MSILRKLALALAMMFSLTLMAAAPATATSTAGKTGDIKVCKKLKDVKHINGKVTFNFVVKEKKSDGGEKDKYKFDLTFKKGDENKKICQKFPKVDVGKYVVKEKGMPSGYKLDNIKVEGCKSTDKNDNDRKVQVELKKDEHCKVIFTNKKR